MIRFSLGPIPVGVHLSFLLIAIVIPTSSIEELVAWVLAAFLAVLLHEAGHAFVAYGYGLRPVNVTLFALGGVTTYPVTPTLTPGRKFIIAASGSAIGILAGGALLLAYRAGWFDGVSQFLFNFGRGFVWAALGWGVLNWVPIRPLDGGAMLTSALQIFVPRYAMPIAKVVSILFAGAAVWFLLSRGSTFGAVFVTIIALVGLRDDPDVAATRERRPAAPTPPPDGPQSIEDVI